jgi:hypothetical protein
VIAVPAYDEQVIEIRMRSELRCHAAGRSRIRLLDGEAIHRYGQAHGRDISEGDIYSSRARSLPATAQQQSGVRRNVTPQSELALRVSYVKLHVMFHLSVLPPALRDTESRRQITSAYRNGFFTFLPSRMKVTSPSRPYLLSI